MSSLIEQAARRLEQLRNAGVDVPGVPPIAAPAGAGSSASSAAAGARAAATAKAGAGASSASAGAAAAPVVSRQVHLDIERLIASGLGMPGAPRSQLTDQYRVIKRPLLRNATGRGAVPLKHGNLIMITSALPGEGKSFTAVNLAMSIAAELDHTVMLVDADVAKPSVPQMLGVEPGPGLLDVLDGSRDLSSVLLRTNVEGLTLLRAGTPHAQATELLASDAMSALLQDMATRYPERIIVFDSPPLLATTEARALATHMGQVVVVVQAERTLQSQVESALATIDACPVRMLLLNQARAAEEVAYGYGYGYGSGSPSGYAQSMLPADAPVSPAVPATAGTGA